MLNRIELVTMPMPTMKMPKALGCIAGDNAGKVVQRRGGSRRGREEEVLV